MSCRCTAAVSPSTYSSAVETRLPPACLETYMPASATRIMSSTENPCTGKLATPKLPLMWCSANIGSVAIHKRRRDRKSTRLNSSHVAISYAVFCLKKKKQKQTTYQSNAEGTCTDCTATSAYSY